MKLAFDAADLAFRDEVRAFLDEALTDELRAAGAACSGIYCERPVAQAWLERLDARGWAAPAWPAEWGGAGWRLSQHYIFQRELTLADAPQITPNAIRMVGPAIIAFGTPRQKAELLPRIRSGQDWWAQGYSEPGAGSDLAALSCRAVRDGDHYRIQGSKIWTTHAHWSNKIFCLVRTREDGKPQAGITFLLFDLDLPGVTIRPIVSISGDHEFNEVFFDDVKAPASGVLGEENQGWMVAKYLLAHERSHQYAPQLRSRSRRLRAQLLQREDGASDSLLRRLAEIDAAIDAVEITELRAVQDISRGGTPGHLASLMKIQGAEVRQRLGELAMEALGVYAGPWQPLRGGPVPDDVVGPADGPVSIGRFFNDRAASIYGGSNEIQRNLLAVHLLGR